MQLRYIVRALISLQAANNSLLINILASGERQPAVEAALAARFGVASISAEAEVS